MLKSHHCGFIVLIGLIGTFSSILTVEAYQAAVVAYKSLYEEDWTPDQFLPGNVNYCANKIDDAKGQADIIVFPEYALTTVAAKDKAKDHLSDYSVVIQENNVNPCDNKNTSDVNLKKLSCAAKSAQIYAVFNVIESYENEYYLTSIVFDAGGNVTLKCRRNYVPKNTPFKRNEKKESCIFTANFKSETVKFLLIQDPDLLGSIPADTTNVILTSATKNTIPFKYAPAMHTGFAVRNKVNLLVAGYVDFDNNYGGSGIYNIVNDRLIGNATLGSSNRNDYIITRQIKEAVKKDEAVQVEVTFSQKTMNLPFSNVTVANTNNTEYKECIKDLCCEFKANTDQQTIYPYRWVIYNQSSLFSRPVDIIYCALIKPNQAPSVTFTDVIISSTYPKTDLGQVIPVAIKSDFQIPVYVYQESESTRSVSLTEKGELISFGIIHVLARGSRTASSSYVIWVVVIVIVALLIGLYLIYKKRDVLRAVYQKIQHKE